MNDPRGFRASDEQRRRNAIVGAGLAVLIAALIATAIGAAYLR